MINIWDLEQGKEEKFRLWAREVWKCALRLDNEQGEEKERNQTSRKNVGKWRGSKSEMDMKVVKRYESKKNSLERKRSEMEK